MVDTTRCLAPPKCVEKGCLETVPFGASGGDHPGVGNGGGRLCAKHKELGMAGLMVRHLCARAGVFETFRNVRLLFRNFCSECFVFRLVFFCSGWSDVLLYIR